MIFIFLFNFEWKTGFGKRVNAKNTHDFKNNSLNTQSSKIIAEIPTAFLTSHSNRSISARMKTSIEFRFTLHFYGSLSPHDNRTPTLKSSDGDMQLIVKWYRWRSSTRVTEVELYSVQQIQTT